MLIKKGADTYPRNTPLQPDVIRTKKDCPTTPDIQQETNTKYGRIHFRPMIEALIYLSSGARPYKTFAVTKLAKYAHIPGEKRYKSLLWFIGYLQQVPTKQYS